MVQPSKDFLWRHFLVLLKKYLASLSQTNANESHTPKNLVPVVRRRALSLFNRHCKMITRKAQRFLCQLNPCFQREKLPSQFVVIVGLVMEFLKEAAKVRTRLGSGISFDQFASLTLLIHIPSSSVTTGK